MILKACPICGNLLAYGATYCTTCKPIAEEEQAMRKKMCDKRYNRGRDPKYTKFYNSKAWRTLSAAYTQGVGFRCERCGGIASEVHHRQPIQTPHGWERRLDWDNLSLLCKSCHNAEHGRFQGKK